MLQIKREKSEEHQQNPIILGERSRENEKYEQHDATININFEAVKIEPVEVPNSHLQKFLKDFETTNILLGKKVFWESEQILGI